MEYIVDSDQIFFDDVIELSEAMKANDFRRINAVLMRCVTDADGNPVERIKAKHAAQLAVRIMAAVEEGDLGKSG
jgi:hypothetical protein